jgi:hypothetical protein
MPYIHTSTLTYPVSEQDIRREFPSVSFPVPFTPPDGYAWVFPAPHPAYDPITHGVREIAPQIANGNYEQRWETYDLPADVIAANQAEAATRLKESIVTATQARLDDFARTRNYDGILSVCTYATSTVTKFQTEGQYCVEARDATWATLYTMLAEVQAGTRPIPSGYQDIEPELPALTWPT